MFSPLLPAEFAACTGISAQTHPRILCDVELIVSPREICETECVFAMPIPYLESLIRNIPLAGDPGHRPYQDCDISLERIDPHSFWIGQTFVQRDKYQNLLENFPTLFNNFCVTRGVAKCNAHILIGKDCRQRTVLAHYVPPLIEVNDGKNILVDGIHRNFSVKGVGTTMESIVIRGVTTPFPCTPHPWKEIRPVDEKPPKEKRYFDLKPDLFRALSAVGIDG